MLNQPNLSYTNSAGIRPALSPWSGRSLDRFLAPPCGTVTTLGIFFRTSRTRNGLKAKSS
jgi:hypothetical protein